MSKVERKGRILESELRIKATPRQVWEAFAEPERVKDWFVDDASGTPKPGAAMEWVWEHYGMRCLVNVLESVPAERLVLEWPMLQGSPLIWEIDVKSRAGETVVKIVSSGFGEGAEWDEQYEGQKSGWPICLAILKHYLEGHFGKRRRDVVVMRKLESRTADVYPFMKQPAELGRWLTREAKLAGEGRPIRLVLRDGRVWTGKILADTGRELCFTCHEIDGLVTLKAFGCGPAAQMVGVHASGWKLSPAEAKKLERTLADAVRALLREALEPAAS